MMHPSVVGRRQIRRDCGLVAGGMTFDFTATADALIGLDMRAGRHFLQKNFDRFRALGAFEREDTGGFQHDGSEKEWRSRHFIIRNTSKPGNRMSEKRD